MTWTKEDVIAFRDRDWAELDRAPVQRTSLQSELLAGSLYEQVRAASPDWPTKSDRDADLAAHIHLVEIFSRAHDAERRRRDPR